MANCRSAITVFFVICLPPAKICNGLSSPTMIHENPNERIAPELEKKNIIQVTDWVSTALGDTGPFEEGEKVQSKIERYASARTLSRDLNIDSANRGPLSSHELVYGELSVPVLATILDAVGIRKGEKFLDIGSGDGALVLGTSILYPDHIERSRGVELVPGLVNRSNEHRKKLRDVLLESEHSDLAKVLDCVEFMSGDIYQSELPLLAVLSDTTLAVCFATTWSLINADGSKTSLDGRRLPKLSGALTRLPKGARIVIVDGKMDEADGYRWEGDLRITCPDTAPYSIASLYSRL